MYEDDDPYFYDDYGQDDYDGQPDEFTEWQDVFGGDVSEYGSYGCYDEDGDFGYCDEE